MKVEKYILNITFDVTKGSFSFKEDMSDNLSNENCIVSGLI